jgi:hydroxymethylpyrimidine pyrophosphatase-like HAD family hydrolase
MDKIIKHPTFFVDIDGTIVKYRKFNELATSTLTPIQDVIDFINKSYDEGCHIVITTARPESYELLTKQELETLGVKYHQMIMGIGRGTRVVLNDKDPENPELPRAWGLNFTRDNGFKDLEIPIFISSYESI